MRRSINVLPYIFAVLLTGCATHPVATDPIPSQSVSNAAQPTPKSMTLDSLPDEDRAAIYALGACTITGLAYQYPWASRAAIEVLDSGGTLNVKWTAEDRQFNEKLADNAVRSQAAADRAALIDSKWSKLARTIDGILAGILKLKGKPFAAAALTHWNQIKPIVVASCDEALSQGKRIANGSAADLRNLVDQTGCEDICLRSDVIDRPAWRIDPIEIPSG